VGLLLAGVSGFMHWFNQPKVQELSIWDAQTVATIRVASIGSLVGVTHRCPFSSSLMKLQLSLPTANRASLPGMWHF
jgi:hypothetical protein